MMLSGICRMSLLLESAEATGGLISLRPRTFAGELAGAGYPVGRVDGPFQPWTAEEVRAAARWWRAVATNREPMGRRHVWFGGGVCFGRVAPLFGADFAIDVIVLDDPDAARPPITYNEGGVEVGDSSHTEFTYITVDTTAEQLATAAAWWEALLP